jgi:hypothetical protein
MTFRISRPASTPFKPNGAVWPMKTSAQILSTRSTAATSESLIRCMQRSFHSCSCLGRAAICRRRKVSQFIPRRLHPVAAAATAAVPKIWRCRRCIAVVRSIHGLKCTRSRRGERITIRLVTSIRIIACCSIRQIMHSRIRIESDSIIRGTIRVARAQAVRAANDSTQCTAKEKQAQGPSRRRCPQPLGFFTFLAAKLCRKKTSPGACLTNFRRNTQ